MFAWIQKLWLEFWAGVKTYWLLLWSTITDLFLKVLEWCLELVADVFNAIPVPDVFASAGDFWASIPGQSVYLMLQLKLPLAFGIIAAAYGIRFALNLVPAALTRV